MPYDDMVNSYSVGSADVCFGHGDRGGTISLVRLRSRTAIQSPKQTLQSVALRVSWQGRAEGHPPFVFCS